MPAHKKIGNPCRGEIIRVKGARKRADKSKRVAMVEFDNGIALDAAINSNELRYLNHSCRPNTFMRKTGWWNFILYDPSAKEMS
ncbi:MAG: SET domain-containing protein-lysine N-methyltransferase [Chitinophagaceae bacterium]